MAYFEITVIGAKELERKLSMLPINVAKKHVRTAVREGAKIIQAEEHAMAMSMVGGEMGGMIANALKVRAARTKRRGSYGVNVIIDPNKNDVFVDVSKSGVRNYIPAAIEYGHITASGGRVAAIPFGRTAFDNKKTSASAAIERDLLRGIEIEASRPA